MCASISQRKLPPCAWADAAESTICGATIYAVGTEAEPIIMSTDQNPPVVGGWGGLVMYGYAQSNQVDCSVDSAESEGGDAGYYCGTNDCDSSGVLKYVRCQYSGITLGQDNELNSFTWNGLGSRTRLSYLQATSGADDAFEWFGGKCNADHLVGTYTNDDGLDFQMGFRGTIQFAVIQQHPSQGDRGIEGDNNENDYDAYCRSNPLIANVTLIGSGVGVGTGSHGMIIRHGSNAHIYNSITTAFNDHGLRIDHNEGCLDPAGLGALVDTSFNPAPGCNTCNGHWVGIDDAESNRPIFASGVRTYPNPTTSDISFSFNMPAAGHATLTIYDPAGREVRRVVDDNLRAGTHDIGWSPSHNLSSGVYFYRLETDRGPETGRFAILR